MLVTHDQKTMPKHFYKFIEKQSSPGIIIVPQSLATGKVAEDLLTIWNASEAEEWLNRIEYLPY